MQLKPITAIIVLLLVVASLLVSGCTVNTSNQTPSASATPSATATPSAQTETTTFTRKRGYSIAYLRAWSRDVNRSAAPSAGPSIDVYFYPNPNNAIDGLNVVTQKLDARTGQTLQGLTDYSLNGFSAGVQDYKLLSYGSTNAGGEPANKVVIQATVPQKISENSTQKAPIKLMQILTIHNGTGYVIGYKTIQDDYDKYVAQAEQAMNSFKFTS